MPTEVLQLEAENRRLSTLVAALAEKNLRLEKEVERLKQTSPDTSHPHEGTMHACANTTITCEGLPTQRFDQTQAPEVLPHNRFNPAPIDTGTTPAIYNPEPGLDGRIIREIVSLPAAQRQRIENIAAEALFEERIARLAGQLPGWKAVAAALKAGPMPRLRWPQERNLPLLLRCLCRTGTDRLPYEAMQKATELSYTGLYKLLQAGCRAGLLQRAGWQRYRLTETGLAVLEAAAHAPAAQPAL